jgi:hypothetical protein
MPAMKKDTTAASQLAGNGQPKGGTASGALLQWSMSAERFSKCPERHLMPTTPSIP